MKKIPMLILSLMLAYGISLTAFAQPAQVRQSPKASVSQALGAEGIITIEYGRPAVKGRVIWGELVPYGLAPGNKYSKDKPYPWRAGANENTILTSNVELIVEGKTLPAGKYSIHMIPSENTWIVIFNKKSDAWGSYAYSQEDDALRVEVKPVPGPFTEWLTFGFEDLAANSATAYLIWERLKVPFRVELGKQ
jgi:hypothetical protein